jgi:hypothetical protein
LDLTTYVLFALIESSGVLLRTYPIIVIQITSAQVCVFVRNVSKRSLEISLKQTDVRIGKSFQTHFLAISLPGFVRISGDLEIDVEIEIVNECRGMHWFSDGLVKLK